MQINSTFLTIVNADAFEVATWNRTEHISVNNIYPIARTYLIYSVCCKTTNCNQIYVHSLIILNSRNESHYLASVIKTHSKHCPYSAKRYTIEIVLCNSLVSLFANTCFQSLIFVHTRPYAETLMNTNGHIIIDWD